ncbi:molybdenum cofactor biosynthesis protein [Egicoccus halophilus]|uniref:Molybdenum cofactor biosynthesis protein D/E n=1 Tax=Egicoccus halophilus TaxID=1670830 RepID=A0A8J3A755_9ACTN|nr:molybdenum cofactor biosynthesis protein MoaE [Egicoccus halophilus]GGI03391.1 molybdenum cofactor biosynthesis protein D/E [Egicoccus halophilus]
MEIEVRLFGGLAERAGGQRTRVEVADDATVADLRSALAAKHPPLAPLLARVNVAVDLEVVDERHPLAGAREVAALPPVAGGAADDHDAPRVLTGLRRPPLAVEDALATIATPDVGATAVFLGTVRDHAGDLDDVVRLDYSAYEAMAEKVLADLAAEVVRDHPSVRGIALLHSVGALPVGAHTILVACTSPHRTAAFAACEDALERVKDRVPVFKREVTGDGAHRWVGLPDA